jgi:hypothetical protein
VARGGARGGRGVGRVGRGVKLGVGESQAQVVVGGGAALTVVVLDTQVPGGKGGTRPRSGGAGFGGARRSAKLLWARQSGGARARVARAPARAAPGRSPTRPPPARLHAARASPRRMSPFTRSTSGVST